MTASESTYEAAESEKDQSAETTEAVEAKQEELPTSAEKVEDDDSEDVDVFNEDSEYSDEDFEDGGNVEGVEGTVFEVDRDGEEYVVPYVFVGPADVAARTSDSDDPSKSWTAQEASGEREDEDGNALGPVAFADATRVPGQTFRVRELPNREVAEAAGVNYDQLIAGLPVRADVPNEGSRKGIPS